MPTFARADVEAVELEAYPYMHSFTTATSLDPLGTSVRRQSLVYQPYHAVESTVSLLRPSNEYSTRASWDKQPEQSLYSQLPAPQSAQYAKSKNSKYQKLGSLHLNRLSLLGLYRYGNGPERILLFIGACCAILGGITMPIMTLIFGGLSQKLGDFQSGRLSKTDFQQDIAFYPLYYVLLGLGKFIVTSISTSVFACTGNSILRRVRDLYFRCLLRQPMEFYDKRGSAEVATRLTVDLNVIQAGISHLMPEFVMICATFVAGVVVMFTQSWKLGLIAISVFIGIALFVIVPARIVARETSNANAATAASSGVASETFSSIRTTLAFGLQDRLFKRFEVHLCKIESASIKARQAVGLLVSVITGITLSVYGLLFWQGSKYLVDGEISEAKLVSVVYAVSISTISLAQLPNILNKLADANAASGKILEMLESESTSHYNPPSSSPNAQHWAGDVTFRDVSFSYPSRPNVRVLKFFSAHFPAGTTTALVGPSGSSKSTIINLLERFYDPSEGRILIGDRNITKIESQWLRQRISLVEQQPVLFQTSIRNNILHGLIGTGNEGRSDVEERLIWAAKTANAHDFICALPDGYETRVGERGLLLSGGQRQRIAIARAVIRDPILLLLDEATSALDTVSEAEIQRALASASKGRSTIVVAHRLSTIQNADNIIVMSNGTIVEQGSHENLMKQLGPYSNMVHNQRIADDGDGSSVHNTLNEVSNREDNLDKHFRERPSERGMERADDLGVNLFINSPTRPSFYVLAKFVSRFSRQEAHWIALGACTAILAGGVIPTQGIFYSKSIDALSKPPSQFSKLREDMNFWAAMYLWLGLFTFLANFTWQWAFAISSGRLIRRMQAISFQSILRQDLEFFDNIAVGSLVAFLGSQAEHLSGISGVNFGTVLTSLTLVIAVLAVSIAITWKLSLVWASTMPILLACGFFRFYVFRRIRSNISIAYDESAGYASEAIAAIRTVISLTREEDAAQEYWQKLCSQAGKVVKLNIAASILYGASEGLPFCCTAIGFFYGTHLLINGEISNFEFFVAFSELTLGVYMVNFIFANIQDFGKATTAANHLRNLYFRRSQVDSFKGPPMNMSAHDEASVELRNVTFTYPGRTEPAVRNLNLHIKTGQKVAFVGQSGCGKSTVINLIERFYFPLSGNIFVNGRDVSMIDLQTYRSNIALVDQVPMLYQGTVRENLLLGANSEVSHEDVIAACRNANIWEFVSTLPDGLNTTIGSNGILMSGGQKQRLCIARALLRRPKILLLDEATSALDSESEKLVNSALETASQNCTTIQIAHRLSTIRHSDVIYVFDKGEIIEQGTHAELWELKGKYFSLSQRQNL